MTASVLLLWASAFSSFTWGMVRFFRKPTGLTCHSGAVAGLGLVFGGWHGFAIATSEAGPWPLGLAMALLAGSTTLFGWAVRACGSRRPTAIFENDVPRYLMRRGPYRYLRHPFYASYTLSWFAGWIASGSILALVSAGIMLWIYIDAARREERKFASSRLDAEYSGYRRTTGLMIPRLSVLRALVTETARHPERRPASDGAESH